jgi:flagellar protein FliS
MSYSAGDNYLDAEVRTATPQKLQLMLIDAALRSANRAQQFWQQGQNDPAFKAILYAEKLLGQMLAAIDPDTTGELGKKVSAIYEYVFRSLVQAANRRDEKSLADAIRVLEIERETWRQLCEKLTAEHHSGPLFPEHPLPGVPHFARLDDFGLDIASAGGFSLEV